LESSLKSREVELHALGVRVEEEQSLVARTQRQLKENSGKVQELEDELEHERQLRQKADRARAELQRELDEASERLDEQAGATTAQVELNKKREMELAKLRRQVEEANQAQETAVASLRKKNAEAVAELSGQLDELQ
uniref:Myosin_tail_1 domain-containing protein n=1 Tax=Anisakis simplex TaxID=6269 RepID=A0A0M3JP17_ANISI